MAKIETFTAGFKRHNQEQTKFIPNALNHKGFLVSIVSEGRGKSWEEGGMFDGEGDSWTVYERYEDVMRPYFDGVLTKKDGVENNIRNSEAHKSFEKAIELGYEKYLLRFDNTDTYEIWNSDQRRQEKFEADKWVYFIRHDCWETGIPWFQLSTYSGRYPTHVFAAMKPYLRYHSEQEEEEGDWKGWATTHNLNDVQEALQKIGWSIINKLN
jgi:hypothetical protein